MKICFFGLNLNDPVVSSIFSGMYKSFWTAIEKFGDEVYYTNSISDLSGDVLVVALGGGQERESSKAMLKFNGPVVIYVPPARSWFFESFLKRWRYRIVFAYGTDASSYSTLKYSKLGIQYIHLPFGSDETIFYPIAKPKTIDILFVGNSHSGVGRRKYISLLMEEASKKNWKVLLVGQGWENYGFTPQIVVHGQHLNELINSSKICINLHNDIQFCGMDCQMDANNRLFDLAMAGCFQVNNAEQLIRLYFTEDEVFAEDDPDKWIKLICDVIENDEIIKKYSEKARIRANEYHTWYKRAAQFNSVLYSKLNDYSNIEIHENIIDKTLMILDGSILPEYFQKLKLKNLKRKLFSRK